MYRGIYVNIPVKVLYTSCANCPRLDVKVNTELLYGNGDMISAENNLECRQLHLCMEIRRRIARENGIADDDF